MRGVSPILYLFWAVCNQISFWSLILTGCRKITEEPWLRADQSRTGCFEVQLGVLLHETKTMVCVCAYPNCNNRMLSHTLRSFNRLPLLASEIMKVVANSATNWCQLKKDLVIHVLEQMKGKRNDLHAVTKDLHYQSKLVSGENKHLQQTLMVAPRNPVLAHFSAACLSPRSVPKQLSPSATFTHIWGNMAQVEKYQSSI